MNKPLMYSGIHAVESLLRHRPEGVLELFVLDTRAKRGDARLETLIIAARDQGIAVQYSRRESLDKLAGPQNQGVVARARPRSAGDEQALAAHLDGLDHPPLLLILEGVTDPHNLGACLRSADAAGAHAVIVPRDRSASLNPTVRKVACGAAETVPLVAVTNLSRTLKQLKQRGLWVVGTAGEADQLIYDVDFTVPSIIIMGAEGAGMRRLTREHCDYLAKLPMAGSVSSLNVSVATGICLFEAVRQRGAAS